MAMSGLFPVTSAASKKGFAACAMLLALAIPARANAQSTPPEAPISGAQRADWIVDGIVSRRSLMGGIADAVWQTTDDTPAEWEQGLTGFDKRYAAREADVAISSAIEAGLGALWGEDPRYHPSRRSGIWSRTRYAVTTVVLAPRTDGRLRPAWARFAGNTLNNVIENAWLPPSATTPRQTALRSLDGFLGRLAGNLWDEFWPDVYPRLKKSAVFIRDRLLPHRGSSVL
jgi:hypothetical protein